MPMELDKEWSAPAARLPHAPHFRLIPPDGLESSGTDAVPEPLSTDGGQGICYLAEDERRPDPRDPSRKARVVIKFLWPWKDGRRYSDEMLAGFRLPCDFQHPNLVRVREVLADSRDVLP